MIRDEPTSTIPEPFRESEANVSIRNFLIFPFAALFALIIAFLTLISFQKGNDAVEQIKAKIRERTLAGVRHEVGAYMRTAHRLNKATHNFISKGHLDINNPLALQDFFWNQLRVYKNVNYIYFGYKEGGITLVARRSDDVYVVRQTEVENGRFPAARSKVYSLDGNGRRDKLIKERKPFDSRTRPWFIKALNNKGPIWSRVYPFFLEDALGITAALPLYDKENQLLGVIATDILLSTFSKVLHTLKPTDKSELFIIQKNGNLIASTSDKEPFIREPEKLLQIPASKSKSPVIRAMYEQFLRKNISSTAENESAGMDVMVDGSRHLVEFFPFKDKLGIDWYIGLSVPEAEIVGPGRETLRLIVHFGVGILILSTILCIFLGQRLSLPLLELRNVASDLANGRKVARARPSNIVEINSLAKNFNVMADEINKSVEALEKKNADLNAEIKQRRDTEKKLRYFKEEIDIKQRTKLASELHDGIGQSLQAINLGLKMLEKGNDTADPKTKLNDMINEVGVAIGQLRDIIDRQRPIFLDQMDILTALEHYGRKLSYRGDFEFTLVSDIERLGLEPIHKEPVFLIFQEALNNAAKYAKASHIKVEVQLKDDHRLQMTIEDNGAGFELDKLAPKHSGLGLSIMSERAQSIGGFLTVSSKPDEGTRIFMEIPLHD